MGYWLALFSKSNVGDGNLIYDYFIFNLYVIMSKKHYDLAEQRALETPIILWRFCAYKTEDHYENGQHYFMKDFFEHTEMKNFSSKHSAKEKVLYPDYCSMYWEIKTSAL
jgi:hypothetical protein